MPSTYSLKPPSRAAIVVNQIHQFFMSFPIVCFTLVLLTDLAYWQTSFLMWHNFSAWLLFAGLVGGAVGLATGLMGVLFWSRLYDWRYWVGVLLVLSLGIVNSFIHAGDGWTAIVPTGMAISAVTVLAILVTVWLGRLRLSSAEVAYHA
jgi:uncharacterized membrane protein